MSKIRLAIDTGGAATCVVLGDDSGAILGEVQHEGATLHATLLAEGVDALLRQCGVRPAQLESVLIGAGPGSFTGLRIAWGFAKGFASALNIPLLCVSSLAAQAFAAAHSYSGDERLLIVPHSDAGRQECFISFYSYTGGLPESFTQIGEDTLLLLSAIQDAVRSKAIELDIHTVLLVGSLASLEPSAHPLTVVNRAHGNGARGLLLLSLRNGGQSWSGPAEIAAIEPNYLRAVAAKTIAERAR